MTNATTLTYAERCIKMQAETYAPKGVTVYAVIHNHNECFAAYDSEEDGRVILSESFPAEQVNWKDGETIF